MAAPASKRVVRQLPNALGRMTILPNEWPQPRDGTEALGTGALVLHRVGMDAVAIPALEAHRQLVRTL